MSGNESAASGETPTGVLIFQATQVDPTLAVFEVALLAEAGG